MDRFFLKYDGLWEFFRVHTPPPNASHPTLKNMVLFVGPNAQGGGTGVEVAPLHSHDMTLHPGNLT